jgi:hypothetical protein
MEEKARLIRQEWYGTLEFLTGILGEEKTIELIEKMSQDYLKARNYPVEDAYLSELHLIARCMAEKGYIIARHVKGEGLVTIISDSSIRITTYKGEINLAEEVIEIVTKCDNQFIQEVHNAWLMTTAKSQVITVIDIYGKDHCYYLTTDEKEDYN